MPASEAAERLLCPVGRRHCRHQRLRLRRDRDRRKHKNKIGKVYAGRHGIVGALTEDLIDTSKESAAAIRALRHTPAGAFGSARYKLKKFEDNPAQYERLIEVFKAHDIGYFFYNGGGDSADTCLKVSQLADKLGYPIQAIHVPKTVDNDLPITDCCPGFGSVAKYVAVSIREAGFDVASMAKTSTKVFIMEVMGRHAGWIAAAGGLAAEKEGDAPHIILFPEITFDEETFCARVKQMRREVRLLRRRRVRGREEQRRQVPVRCRPARRVRPCAARRRRARCIAQLVKVEAQLQVSLGGRRLPAARRAPHRLESRRRAGLCGRQGGGRARAQGPQLGDADDRARRRQAVPMEDRHRDARGRWRTRKRCCRGTTSRADGFHITAKARRYLSPLIRGEDYPPYKDGLPQYVTLKNAPVRKKLATTFVV